MAKNAFFPLSAETEVCERLSVVKSLCSDHLVIYKDDAEVKLSLAIGADRNPVVFSLVGTKTTDNVCEACPPGTFSTTNMSYSCTPWPG